MTTTSSPIGFAGKFGSDRLHFALHVPSVVASVVGHAMASMMSHPVVSHAARVAAPHAAAVHVVLSGDRHERKAAHEAEARQRESDFLQHCSYSFLIDVSRDETLATGIT